MFLIGFLCGALASALFMGIYHVIVIQSEGL